MIYFIIKTLIKKIFVFFNLNNVGSGDSQKIIRKIQTK